MNVIKTSNTGFKYLNNKHKNAQQTSTANSQTEANKVAGKVSTSRQLVPVQPIEYKRFNNIKQHSDNAFLAQYIDQSNSQRRRAFIGRKPAWQAKNTYQNANDILDSAPITQLDTAI